MTGPLGGALHQRRCAARDAARGHYEASALARRDALWSINRARLRRASRRGDSSRVVAIQRLINRFDILLEVAA